MAGEFSTGAQINLAEKFHGVARPKLPQEKDLRQEDSLVEGEERSSGVSWMEEGEGQVKAAVSLDKVVLMQTNQSVSVASRTVMQRAEAAVSEFLGKLKAKLLEHFEEACKNLFSYNKLIAGIAAFDMGITGEALSRMGVSPEEISEIKTRVRTVLIRENTDKMIATVRAKVQGNIYS